MKARGGWHVLAEALVLAAFAGNAWPFAGEPPALLLAETEHGQADVALYLVSEKLDGVRAYWDGRRLLSRRGNVIAAPPWFIERLPPQPLDGELWLGRGKFDRLSAIVRRQAADDEAWREVRYLAFELPQAPGTFRQRARALRELVGSSGVPWLQAVEQLEFNSRQALERKLSEVMQSGGEGLMLHRADAPYLTGRSDVLLKLKRWLDAEATVIGHRPGQGKYAGQLGALRVRTADGVEFLLGTGLTDALRRDPPPPGTRVTFRYRELTSQGRPRFASFHRVLYDF